MTSKKPAKTSNLRAEDLAALTLFNSAGHRVLCIDFDDLAERFPTAEEASAAHEGAARVLHGEFYRKPKRDPDKGRS